MASGPGFELSAAVTTDPADARGPRRWDIEVVADSDSRWKWGATLARRIAGDADAAPRVHATLLEGRSCPTDRQLADIGEHADSRRRLSLGETVQQLATTQADVVVLACLGSGVQALLHGLARAWAGRARRPVVVTGYVGLVYEKVVDGLLLRAGADVVLANSALDAQQFRRSSTRSVPTRTRSSGPRCPFSTAGPIRRARTAGSPSPSSPSPACPRRGWSGATHCSRRLDTPAGTRSGR